MSEPNGGIPPVTRRDFVRLVGASLALAGLDGCARLPAERIVPFQGTMPESDPRPSRHYATSMVLDGLATGLVVQTHEGRPTKIEGNPAHPASLGGASAIELASVFGVYDPDRATSSRVGTRATSWVEIAAGLAPATLRNQVGARGNGLRLLMEPSSSPLVGEMLSKLREVYPEVGIHFYAPSDGWLHDPALQTATGLPVVARYDLTAADVIVALDADCLSAGPFHLRYARQFADGRRLATPGAPMNRLYVAEPMPTPTGMAADHRFAVRSGDIAGIASAMAAIIGSGSAKESTAGAAGSGNSSAPPWVSAVAHDLLAHAGRALVIAGSGQPASVHALAHQMNVALGAVGRSVMYSQTPLLGASVGAQSVDVLLQAQDGGAVGHLICLGGNPWYTMAGESSFATHARRAANRGYLGLYENETAADATWFVPESHYLESWGDCRALDGTLSVVQPLLQPLYPSKTVVDLLGALAGMAPTPVRTLLQASWQSRLGASAADEWNHILREGVADGTASPSVPVVAGPALGESSAPGPIEVVYRFDGKVHDGAFANNGWLQELPAPVTTLTWDNAAMIAASTAHRLGVATGESLAIHVGTRTVTVPAFVVPGMADGSVVLAFGYGRTGHEHTAAGIGTNVYPLWGGSRPGFEAASIARGASGRHGFAVTQPQLLDEGRRDARAASLEAYRAKPSDVGDVPRVRRPLTLFQPKAESASTPQWAMTIDLGACTGCGACVVACQSENNSPVVGAAEVAKGHAMQWMRIDRYESEDEAAADAPINQPMLCQHCEQAPCEYVCPVEATVHSDDGLNEMVYNRCVGTRFCSNNCPYKVRRFNWFDYNAHIAETVMMAKNPDVTVRDRGVMEKCTFCVQRIREAEIDAEIGGVALRGDSVETACAQACPSRAILFGSLTEPDSAMMRAGAQPRAYSVLAELGTRPRVTYLAKIRNLNPALEPSR